jgi:hypothetical protein
MKTLITTVGTSLLTKYNALDKAERSEIKDYRCINDVLNSKYIKDCPASNSALAGSKINIIEDTIKSRWFCVDGQPNVEASAEIKSILKIREQVGEIRVHLLASDSVASVLAAQLIKQWFERYQKDIGVSFDETKDILPTFEEGGFINPDESVVIPQINGADADLADFSQATIQSPLIVAAMQQGIRVYVGATAPVKVAKEASHKRCPINAAKERFNRKD